MDTAHEILLGTGLLLILAIMAGMFSARMGTPLLLAFLGIGMLAGEDGPGHIQFDDYRTAYLVGSLAMAIILFEGGLATRQSMIRQALWPSLTLATLGVAISTGLMGTAIVWLFGVSWPSALLLGAVISPTDAAAVGVQLRLSKAQVPSRLISALEIESGLNDPMSVFLTLALVEILIAPTQSGLGRMALLFIREMGGGVILGLAGGFALLGALRLLKTEHVILPIFALGGCLLLFGGAQVLGASGFMAVYLAGIVIGNTVHPATVSIVRFFETLGWLAQISLFLILGLLVTPHALVPLILPALATAGIMIFIARPAATFACLTPFRWKARESAFVSWVGLRGAVPIFLTIIPVLEGMQNGETLFSVVYVIVLVSVAIQGSTIVPMARLLRLKNDDDSTTKIDENQQSAPAH